MASKRDKILKTAEKLVNRGKVEQAIREYEKLLKVNPNDANTINRVGDLYGRVGQIDKAVELYERLASRFAEEGFTPKAIAIYKKINRLAPQRLDIFEKLGDLYVEQGLVVEAKNQFHMLAEHYAKNEDIESSIRVHERLGDIDPGDHTIRLKLADLLLESGESEKAMEAYGDLGRSLIAKEQLDEAERLYRRLLDYDLPDGEIMVPICERMLEIGRVTAAQELLTVGLGVSPESVPLRTLQVRAHMSLGENEAAVELAREILEVDPDNPVVRGLVGNVLMSDGDQDQATEMMIPAAEALLEQADYSRAQKMLQELVKVAPTDERVLRLAIRAFRPSGDQEMLFDLTESLADVCFQAGQSDQAKRLYMELVANEPTNQLFRERLAHLDGVDVNASENAVTSGVASESLPSEIDFVLDSEEDETPEADAPTPGEKQLDFDPSERVAEAAVFAKYGLNDKAVAHLEGVVRQVPNDLEAREALARMYVTVGNRELAASAIGPVVEDHRERGEISKAEALEAMVGLPAPPADGQDAEAMVVDQDDEVIIVDFDEGDADGIAGFEPEKVAPAGSEDVVAVEPEDDVAAEPEVVVAPEPEVVVAPEPGVFVAPEPEPVVAPEPDAVVTAEPDEIAAAESEIDAPEGPQSGAADQSIDEMVAAVVKETKTGQTATTSVDYNVAAEALLASAIAPQPAEKRPVEVDSRVIDDELVEISAGTSGPSSGDLEQLDFFIKQELFEDAVGILRRLENDFPGDQDLALRREQLADWEDSDQVQTVEEDFQVVSDEDVQAVDEEIQSVEEDVPGDTAGGGAGARRTSMVVEPVDPGSLRDAETSSEELFGDGASEDFIDLAKELEEELAEEEAMVEEATGRGKGEALLEEVFKEFQKGVAEQLSDEDSDTHFNLGIAYKEMGLLDEAIGEFQVASHDPTYFVEACTMIGVCSIELSKYHEAAEWYQKALVAPDLSVDARTALRYELASAFEKTGEHAQAVGLFEEIIAHDPSYRDVTVRLEVLTQQQRQVN